MKSIETKLGEFEFELRLYDITLKRGLDAHGRYVYFYKIDDYEMIELVLERLSILFRARSDRIPPFAPMLVIFSSFLFGSKPSSPVRSHTLTDFFEGGPIN